MNRIEQIYELLDEKACFVYEESYPYFHRTVVMKDEPTYKFGILGDSIVFGTYVKETMIVSYPGATLERLSSDAVLEEFVKASHWGSDRSWYQQSCGQEKTNRNSRRNCGQTGNPRKEVPRSRDSSDNREDPRKGGVQRRGEAAQQEVRESSEAYRSPPPNDSLLADRERKTTSREDFTPMARTRTPSIYNDTRKTYTTH